MARSGLRLQLFKQQAQAGDIILLHEDESEALTHPYLAHLWARRGRTVRIEAPGQARKRGILGVREVSSGHLHVVTSATKRSSDFIALLGQLDQVYGPQSGRPQQPVVLVLDNGPIHTSKATTKALLSRPWLQVEWLPKYAPELNEIERDWRHLKRHHLANRTFRDVDDLDRSIHEAIDAINIQRSPRPCIEFQPSAELMRAA